MNGTLEGCWRALFFSGLVLAVGCGAPSPAASTPAASTPAASTPAASTPAASTGSGGTVVVYGVVRCGGEGQAAEVTAQGRERVVAHCDANGSYRVVLQADETVEVSVSAAMGDVFDVGCDDTRVVPIAPGASEVRADFELEWHNAAAEF